MVLDPADGARLLSPASDAKPRRLTEADVDYVTIVRN